MPSKDNSRTGHRPAQIGWVAALMLLASGLGMFVTWRVPGLELYARNWLTRARGPLPVPDDIAIVAIDEASLARFGRYPWRRNLTAQMLDQLAAAHPKVISLDVLFSDATNNADDSALALAIAKAGNVVTAAQLTRTESGRVVWLRPLPSVERAAAGVGHVHVSTEVDGVAGSFLVRQADDQGQAEWAMALETIRVGEGANDQSIQDLPGAVSIGGRAFPVRSETRTIEIESGRPRSIQRLRASWIPIEYVGPAGSFAPYTFSFGDVLDGKVPASAFRGKYVIVGATAAALGDRFISPFVHMEGPNGQQYGEFVPGAEILANSLNTLLRRRSYSETPDWIAAACAALVALLTLGGLSIAQGKHEILKQGAVVVLLGALILGLSYLAFTHWLIFPPIVPSSVSFVFAIPLVLLHRSLVASRELDVQIQQMAHAESWLWPSERETKAGPAALISQLTNARGVAILRYVSAGKYRVAANHGPPLLPSILKSHGLSIEWPQSPRSPKNENAFSSRADPEMVFLFHERQDIQAQQLTALKCALGDGNPPAGFLIVLHQRDERMPLEPLRISLELAYGFIVALGTGETANGEPMETSRRTSWHLLPRGLTWKTRALGALNQRLLADSRFVDKSLRSVGDGLLVAGIGGQIVFVNRRATEILEMKERSLLGSSLFGRLGQPEKTVAETLERLLVDRAAVEREITFGGSSPRHFILRLSPVCENGDDRGAVVGIVASLSDITKQQELQQMKTEVVSLVTHELRTPLTAIQGMSEVLAQFDVDPGRRREMHTAINEEAKRLARMIDEYLDITRLEAGARPLRKMPLRVEALIERVLLLLDPLASSRGIPITREFDKNLPAVMADADLLAQAVTNVIANAIKYSPRGRQIRVSVRTDRNDLLIAVADKGYGIASQDVKRIFEKFYRVSRVEKTDEPGTGLGLAFVREIMDSHGGYATVESELGTGSTFTLHLPVEPRDGNNLTKSADG
jgi:signal transduction histidine kinase/CHASE2 domain-containing sensor protein